MKIIVTFIPSDLVKNLFLTPFSSFVKPKTKIRFPAIWWSDNKKFF